MIALLRIVLRLPADLVALVAFAVRPQRTSAVEILVRRRQLPLYKGHGIRTRRIAATTRTNQALLHRLRNWRSCLTIVRPKVGIGWQRAGDCAGATNRAQGAFGLPCSFVSSFGAWRAKIRPGVKRELPTVCCVTLDEP